MKTSVTRLLGLGLTPGKLRGLQRICNDNGTLTMVATDQNNSVINMIRDAYKKKGEDRDATYDEIVEAKNTLTQALAPHASGILVDAYYGCWNALASLRLSRNTGMLVRVERSGGDKNKVGAPLGEVEPGWGVAKIKSFGADAVKLLAQYEPTEPHSSEHQFAFVQQIYEECKRHDILLVLETVAFPYGGEKKDSKSFLARKAETVIESARQLSRFCDVYKAEFPGWPGEPRKQLEDNIRELNKVCERPWVLLSAGVDFDQYKEQVEMAMPLGASGVLGGRAFWKEYFTKDTQAQREEFVRTVSADRVKQIHQIVVSKAMPWFVRYGLTAESFSSMYVNEGWHYRYGEFRKAGGSTAGAAGEVY